MAGEKKTNEKRKNYLVDLYRGKLAVLGKLRIDDYLYRYRYM